MWFIHIVCKWIWLIFLYCLNLEATNMQLSKLISNLLLTVAVLAEIFGTDVSSVTDEQHVAPLLLIMYIIVIMYLIRD